MAYLPMKVAEMAKDSRVICVEPMPPLVDCLKKNVRPQDRIVEAAAGDIQDEIILDYLPHYTMLSGLGASQEKEKYQKVAQSNSIAINAEHHFQSQKYTVKVTNGFTQ